ncbi:MAG: guanylate kinase [Clostridia bacterium]|nr:guanylate kinase [Clostridia bacterium]
MMRKGILFIISGPAGSGKGTVVKELISAHSEIALSVSATTRNPRPGEENGVHYYFISKDEFEKRIERGEILEYTTYCENYYGTPLKEVKKALDSGKDIILEIEVDGAMQVKKKVRGSIAIMLTPPDAETLERRLRGRGTETEDVIKWRLERAKEEIKLLPKYDYSVVNEDGKSNECAELIYDIIKAEHQNTKNTKKEIIKKFI